MSDLVTYNGYEFNEYSNLTVNATMQHDEAGMTVLYNRYRLRVETTIYAEDGDIEGVAGEHFERIRDRLSKQGQSLEVHHRGFGLNFKVNFANGAERDVSFGPKPIILSWFPVGQTNAVEVVWECEVCISSCNRWSGLMSFNYGISTRIDKAGYTTRTISGNLEIAMSRTGRLIPDTADAYRSVVVVAPPPNFERETTWDLSMDKKRIDFSIVDSQIRSPNAYPDGVISIRASHGINWSRMHGRSSQLENTIRATVELGQGQPRSRAIEIFLAILNERLRYVNQMIVESFIVDEELFGNTFNFSVGYRTYVKPSESILAVLPSMFEAGYGEPVSIGSWESWKASISHLQSHRGQANLSHTPNQDQIVDLCAGQLIPLSTSTSQSVPYTPPSRIPKFYNKKPPANQSYLHFESYLETDEEVPTTIQITVGKDDLAKKEFNPSDPTGGLGDTDTASQVERFVESQAGRIEIVWKGYAERVGFQIPRPDKLKIGDVTLTRIGKGRFVQKFLGSVLGQPVYAAAWNQRYVVSSRPPKMLTKDTNEWEGR